MSSSGGTTLWALELTPAPAGGSVYACCWYLESVGAEEFRFIKDDIRFRTMLSRTAIRGGGAGLVESSLLLDDSHSFASWITDPWTELTGNGVEQLRCPLWTGELSKTEFNEFGVAYPLLCIYCDDGRSCFLDPGEWIATSG